MAQGWIKIHRKLRESFIWEDKPFDRTHAWIDLLLSANHQTKKIALGNEIIEVERGSFITSEQKLMARWGWSKTKVRAFLQLLQNNLMIVKKTDRKKTTINIVNYGLYQDSETTEEPQKDHKKTNKKPQKDLNKNDKELKNEKEEIPYVEIIEYLNKKAGTNYRSAGQATKDKILARWNNKFTLEDFKKVIDNKTAEWLGTDQEKYLRPETLFGNKFEGYLNQKPKQEEGRYLYL